METNYTLKKLIRSGTFFLFFFAFLLTVPQSADAQNRATTDLVVIIEGAAGSKVQVSWPGGSGTIVGPVTGSTLKDVPVSSVVTFTVIPPSVACIEFLNWEDVNIGVPLEIAPNVYEIALLESLLDELQPGELPKVKAVFGDYSIYEFSVDLGEPVCPDTDVDLALTFATVELKQCGYDNVRYAIKAEGPGVVSFEEAGGTAFDDSGYYPLPPSPGFNLPADFDETTNWTLNFSESGDYTITFSLIKAPDGAVIAGTMQTFNVTVNPEPIVGFSFNGELAVTDSEFVYCYDELITVTLSHIYVGEAPFEIEWTVDGVAHSKDNVALNGELFSNKKDPGTYVVEITSIIDANGCEVKDVTPYRATVVVKEEAALGFSFNGVLADTEDVFTYCFNETVTVTLSHIWEGTAPFNIAWTVNGTPGSKDNVNLNDDLFVDILEPGNYEIVITSITGADDCPVVDLTPYKATVVIKPETAVGFSFNGNLADTNDEFEYCYSDIVSVTLSHVWEGTAPFDIEWTVNGVAESKNNVSIGDELFSGQLLPGEYEIVITSIVGADDCEVVDLTPYTATVIVHPEPVVGFSFNGDLAGTNDVFEFCYDETITVTLSHVLEGTAPFEIEWTVNGDVYAEAGVALGGELFSGVKDPGTYDIVITSITDANGCVVADVSPYQATVIVKPEIAVGFSFNGTLADTGDEFEFCFDEIVSVTLSHVWVGTAPFDITWTVNGVEASETGVEINDVLFSGLMVPETYVIQITEIVGADGCEVVNLAPYTATVIVNPEPVVGFSFNGDLAGTGDEFDYCYEEEITVTLSHVWAGTAPFDVEWTVNGVAYAEAGVAVGGELFSGVKDPGTYNIVITSITDAKGCEADDLTPYQATVIVKPESAVGFSFNGNLADTNDTFEYCYNEMVSVTLSHVWVGSAPFDITWEVDGVEASATAVEIDDVLFSGLMDPGTYVIQITEIVGADDCKVVDLTPYTATVIVHPEPIVGFSFNGVLADTGDEFELCYDELLTVSLSHVWAGTAPFDIEWTVNGVLYDAAGVVQGETLFSGIQAPGTYVIQITSIVDDNGCVVDDTSPYTATVVVHPMPVVGFSFNGNLADTGDVFDYCFDEEIVVTLSHVWVGEAPFAIEWTVNGVAYNATDVAEGGTLFSGLRDPGTYNIEITAITDDNGCVVDDVAPYQAIVVVHPEPVAEITGNPDDICSDGVVTLVLDYDAPDFGNPFTVTWFVNGEEAFEADSETSFVFDVEDFVTDPTVSQDITVHAHIVNQWGCESTTDAVSIHVIGRPIITNNTIITPEFNVYCSVIPAGIIIVGDGEVEWEEMPTHEDCEPVFQWYRSTNNGATWSKVGGEGTLAFYQMPQLTQTTWYQRWVTLDDCGCNLYPEDWHKSNIVKMYVIQPFGVAEIADTAPAPLCIDSQITLTGNAVPADAAPWVTGEWTYTGPGIITFDPDQFDPQAIVTADKGGEYLLTWSWDVAANVAGNCDTDSEAHMTLFFDEIVSVDELAAIDPLCYDATPVLLNVPAYDVIGNVESLVFSGDGVVLDGDDFVFDATAVAPGDHVITFTLTTEGGCVETLMLTVTVNEEPLVGFSFNGVLAATDSEFVYCYDTEVTVTLSHVWAGAEPFDIVYKVNDVEFTAMDVELDDELFSELLAVGVYNIEIVSIVDANGCTPSAIGDYQASVVINEEPLVGFSFNGELADTDSEFVYCYDTPVSVTLSHVWAGAQPFDIVYKVNDDEFTATGLEFGDVLFNNLLSAGEYNIEILSIVDANGCVPSAIEDYTATVIINAEPFVGFSFNGVLAGANDAFEYCYNTEVTVTLSHVWAGKAPFDLAWTVNGVEYTASGVEPGDVLFTEFLAADDYDVVITSIVDANNCERSDLSDYTATVVIHEEPIIGFAFNGIPAPHNAVFEFCEELGVSVTLDAIYGGTAPFDIVYQINDEAPVSHTGLNLGDVIYTANPAAGLYTVKVLEIADANGCVAGDAFLDVLIAEVTILEEPYVNIAFNGETAGYNAAYTYSYNEPVSVTLSEVIKGKAPFDLVWTVTDQDGVVTEGSALGVEEGGVIFASDGLEEGVYFVELISLTDANNCSTADLTGFNATITVLKVAELDEDAIYATARTVYASWDAGIYDTWQVMLVADTKDNGDWVTVEEPFVLIEDLDPATDYVIWLRTLKDGVVVGDTDSADLTTITAGDVDGSLTDGPYENGVTITDITLIVDKITNNLGARVVVFDAEELAAQDGGPVFIFDAADMNNDGVIDIFDIVRAVNVLFPPDADKMNGSQSADIYLTPDAIRLDSDGSLVALQIELIGENLADVNLDMQVPGLEIVWTIEGNTLTAYVFSLNNQLIEAGKNILIETANVANLQWGEVFASNLSAEKVEVNTHYDMPTDIFDDFNAGLSLDVYPNPSKGDFTSRVDLPVNANVTFILYDLGGRQVAFKQVDASAGTENVAWNVDLNPGMYVLRMIAKPLDRTDRFTREVRVIIN